MKLKKQKQEKSQKITDSPFLWDFKEVYLPAIATGLLVAGVIWISANEFWLGWFMISSFFVFKEYLW